jgi:hypothetical protein
MDEVTRERAHRSWRIAERVKRLSDGLVRIGPWGLGVDAVIDWVPGGGPIYSAGAGALLIYEAIAAGASKATLARMAAYLLLDTGASSVPLIGWAADALFTGHALAAGALQKDVERRFGKPAFPAKGFGFGPSEGGDAEIDLPPSEWKAKR